MIIKLVFIILILSSPITFITGCLSNQQIRAVILDENGNPIEGAILYYEIYTGEGAFDFGFSVSGDSGEVPPQDKPDLISDWKPGARIAFAAFFENKKPTVLYDQLGNIPPTGLAIKLNELSNEELQWEPRISKLSFPFENNSKLRERLTNENTNELIKVFTKAYTPLIERKVTVFEWEIKKIETLLKIASLKN
ncbi:MAG: hypothetical protein KGZ85_16800 [Ignavibacterium sp.]|nr:hypothetical protein [Ignavibacterium sp.]